MNGSDGESLREDAELGEMGSKGLREGVKKPKSQRQQVTSTLKDYCRHNLDTEAESMQTGSRKREE